MIVRPAHPEDADQMTALLNGIISKGGTTAYETHFNTEKIITDYIAPKGLISCYVADLNGVVGFQRLINADTDPSLHSDWGIIATFVADGMGGKGIGGQLFAMTTSAARIAGIKTIDATIRADNKSGLGYYEAMGFVDYGRIRDVPLKNGAPVDRVRKRFDL